METYNWVRRHRGATIMSTMYDNIARDWALKDDKSDSQK